MTNNITFNNNGSFTFPAYLTAYLTNYDEAGVRGKSLSKAMRTRLINRCFGDDACISLDKLKAIHNFGDSLNPVYDKNEVLQILSAFVFNDEYDVTHDELTASGEIATVPFKYLD